MIDLKLSKKEKESHLRVSKSAGPTEDYPWGTQLSFDTEQIKKLGIEKMSPGDVVAITAIAKVIEKRTNERDKSKKTEYMEIQIQKIEIMTKEDRNEKLRAEVASEVFGD